MPRTKTRKPSSAASEEANELRRPASSGFQSLGERRRSVRANASLQNQLRKGGRAGRPRVREVRDACQLPIIEGVNLRNKIVGEQTRMHLGIRRLDRNRQSRTQRFAAGRLLIAATGLNRGRFGAMTMRHGFPGARFDRAQDTMIRNREPRRHRQHDDEKFGHSRGLVTHDPIRSSRMPERSSVLSNRVESPDGALTGFQPRTLATSRPIVANCGLMSSRGILISMTVNLPES